MADNEHPPQDSPQPPVPAEEVAPTPPAGLPAPVEPAAPPAVRESSGITPDQVRQFQEFQQFQQFQELMRQQAEQGLQPPASPPPPGYLQPWGPPPKQQSAPVRFLKALGGKILTAVLVVALLGIAGFWAIDHFFGQDNADQSADKVGGGGTDTNIVFDRNPYEMVRKVYDYTAQNRDGVKDTNLVCLRFTDDARAQFAENMGFADCDAAIRALSDEVTDPNAYAESMPSATAEEITGKTVRISSCDDSYDGIKGGPPLGLFTVSQIEGSKDGQWIISGHRNETCTPATPTS